MDIIRELEEEKEIDEEIQHAGCSPSKTEEEHIVEIDSPEIKKSIMEIERFQSLKQNKKKIGVKRKLLDYRPPLSVSISKKTTSLMFGTEFKTPELFSNFSSRIRKNPEDRACSNFQDEYDSPTPTSSYPVDLSALVLPAKAHSASLLCTPSSVPDSSGAPPSTSRTHPLISTSFSTFPGADLGSSSATPSALAPVGSSSKTSPTHTSSATFPPPYISSPAAISLVDPSYAACPPSTFTPASSTPTPELPCPDSPSSPRRTDETNRSLSILQINDHDSSSDSIKIEVEVDSQSLDIEDASQGLYAPLLSQPTGVSKEVEMRVGKDFREEVLPDILEPRASEKPHDASCLSILKNPKKGTLLEMASKALSALKKDSALFSHEISVGLRRRKGNLASDPLLVQEIYPLEDSCILQSTFQGVLSEGRENAVKSAFRQEMDGARPGVRSPIPFSRPSITNPFKLMLLVTELSEEVKVNSSVVVHFPVLTMFDSFLNMIFVFVENKIQKIPSEKIEKASEVQGAELEAELTKLQINAIYIFTGFALSASSDFTRELRSVAEYYSGEIVENKLIFMFDLCTSEPQLQFVKKCEKTLRPFSSMASLLLHNDENSDRLKLFVKFVKCTEKGVMVGETEDLLFRLRTEEPNLFPVPFSLEAVYFKEGEIFFDKFSQCTQSTDDPSSIAVIDS